MVLPAVLQEIWTIVGSTCEATSGLLNLIRVVILSISQIP